MRYLDNTSEGLSAIKEVNTSAAQVGDLLSYTITLDNRSSQLISGIVITDLIDKSLEVEKNSIGINGTAISNQSLRQVHLPDLLPGGQGILVFNAYVKRLPNNSQHILREAACVSFTLDGQTYIKQTTPAVTVINSEMVQPSYLETIIIADRESAVLGEDVRFKIIIKPNTFVRIENISLFLDLESSLEIIPKSVRINGNPLCTPCNPLILPDIEWIRNKRSPEIWVTFTARVITVPDRIRALTWAAGRVYYKLGSCEAMLATLTNEALVEIFPPQLCQGWYATLDLSAMQGIQFISDLRAENIVVIPHQYEPYGMFFDISYMILLAYTDLNGQMQLYESKQIVEVKYPYNANTEVYVWTDKECIICKDKDKLQVMVYMMMVN